MYTDVHTHIAIVGTHRCLTSLKNLELLVLCIEHDYSCFRAFFSFLGGKGCLYYIRRPK